MYFFQVAAILTNTAHPIGTSKQVDMSASYRGLFQIDLVELNIERRGFHFFWVLLVFLLSVCFVFSLYVLSSLQASACSRCGLNLLSAR